MKKSLFFIRLTVSIVILGILIYKIGIKKITEAILSINPVVFLISIALYLIVIYIGAYNIVLLINKINQNIKLKTVFRYVLLGWSMGLYLPSKIGEFSLGLFLKKQKVDIGKTAAVVLIDIAISVIVLGLIGVLGILKLGVLKTFNLTIMNFMFITLMFILACMLSYFILISNIGRRIIRTYILRKYSKIFKGFHRTFKIIIEDKKILVINAILTLNKFIISSAITFIIFLALGQYIPLIAIVLITALTVLISTIPITINGLGLRELSAVYFYSLLNTKPEITISVYIIHTIIQYIISIIVLTVFSNELVEMRITTKKVLHKNSLK